MRPHQREPTARGRLVDRRDVPRRRQPHPHDEDGEEHVRERVQAEHERGADVRHQHARDGRTGDRAGEVERADQRVRREPLLVGQQLGQQGVLARAPPRVQQRRDREQSDVQRQRQHPGEPGERHRRRGNAAHHVVGEEQPPGRHPAQPTAEHQRADHAGQRVRGHRGADPEPGGRLRRELDGEPRHRDEAHPVAEVRDARSPGSADGTPGSRAPAGRRPERGVERCTSAARVRRPGPRPDRLQRQLTSKMRIMLPAGSRNAQSRMPHGWSVGSWTTSASRPAAARTSRRGPRSPG